MSEPTVARCPECEGVGIRTYPYWTSLGGGPYAEHRSAPVTCRRCAGSGVLPVAPRSEPSGAPDNASLNRYARDRLAAHPLATKVQALDAALSAANVGVSGDRDRLEACLMANGYAIMPVARSEPSEDANAKLVRVLRWAMVDADDFPGPVLDAIEAIIATEPEEATRAEAMRQLRKMRAAIGARREVSAADVHDAMCAFGIQKHYLELGYSDCCDFGDFADFLNARLAARAKEGHHE